MSENVSNQVVDADHRFNQLLTAMSLGELPLAEKIELTKLMQAKVEKEKAEQFDNSIDKIKELIESLGLTIPEVIKSLQQPPKLLIKWGNYSRYEGERGGWPDWVMDFKKLGKEECIKYVVNNEHKGILFINNLFKK